MTAGLLIIEIVHFLPGIGIAQVLLAVHVATVSSAHSVGPISC